MAAWTSTLYGAPDPMPFSELRTVYPPGVSAGGEVMVNVEGANLEDLTSLQFSHAGLRGEKTDGGFKVTASEDLPVGLYEVRVRGRFGLSNPRPFAVSAWREVLEDGSNQSVEKAQRIEIGQVVNGRANARAYDHYRFQAKAGQRLFLECHAGDLDSRLDPVLVLFSEDERELARSRRGGLIDFSVTVTGEYVVKVYDFLYRGGSDYFYRLALHEGPYLDYILPPAARPGGPSAFTVYGRNLPGGEPAAETSVDGQSLQKLSVEIELPSAAEFQPPTGVLSAGEPADGRVDWIEWRLKTETALSNPLRIYRAQAPVVLEKEPNDEPTLAQKVTLPCEVSGQYYPSRDRDWIEFEAQKDEVWWIEVFSDRLGQPTDPFVLVQRVVTNDKGEEKLSDVKELYDFDTKLGEREFDMDTRDAVWKFEVKETGTYRVMTQDLFHYAEGDPAHIYRLSLRPATPDFRLVTVPESPRQENNDDRKVRPWHVFLRKGETWPLKVLAFRQDDFQGEIQLTVAGLPEGIHAATAVVPANHDEGYIFLTAAQEKVDWAGPLSVKGQAKIQDQSVEHYSRFATVMHSVNDYNNEFIQSRLSTPVTVSGSAYESAAVRVAATENQKAVATVDTEWELPVRLDRREGFDQNIKFKLVGHDALGKVKEWEVDGKATNASWKINLKEYQVPQGIYQVALQGLTKGKYRDQPEAAAEAEEASKQAEALAQEAAEASTQAGKELEQAAQALQEAEKTVQSVDGQYKEAAQSLEQAPQDEKRIAAQAEAQQKLTAAQASLTMALASKAALEKAKAEAEVRKTDTEKAKKEAADRAKAAVERAKPRDILLTVYSEPFTLEVVAPPPPPPPPAEEKKVAQNTN